MSLKILGVSGHRPQKAGKDSRKLTMFAQLMLLQQQPDKVLTGMAVGWDQAVAHACVQLRIPFTAAVPFEGYEDRWPQAVQDSYFDLLRHADTVVMVNRPGYEPEKMRKRNRWIADHSTKAAVLYDGLGDSGTAHFVRQASLLGIPYVNLWADWLVYQAETP